jgi:hypothetical protein
MTWSANIPMPARVRQYVTVQEFKHFDQIPTTFEKPETANVRLIHFTTTIRPDNSAVLVMLWESMQ